MAARGRDPDSYTSVTGHSGARVVLTACGAIWMLIAPPTRYPPPFTVIINKPYCNG